MLVATSALSDLAAQTAAELGLPDLRMVPVALAGHVISNSAHLPSSLLMICPARATGPVSNNEGKWAEVRNNEGT